MHLFVISLSEQATIEMQFLKPFKIRTLKFIQKCFLYEIQTDMSGCQWRNYNAANPAKQGARQS